VGTYSTILLLYPNRNITTGTRSSILSTRAERDERRVRPAKKATVVATRDIALLRRVGAGEADRAGQQ
jgi:hypothetical protein